VLSLYGDKESLIHNLDPNDTDMTRFLEKPWGKLATMLQGTISRLETRHWDLIKETACGHLKKAKLQELGEDMVNGKDEESSYPHARLII
jgi:hypothetical protein